MTRNKIDLLEEIKRSKKQNRQLKQKLNKATETLGQIKIGNIDALVSTNKDAFKVYTEGASAEIFRILVEGMNEGAVTLNKGGTILYCNSHFAKLVALPLEKLIGRQLVDFVDHSSKQNLQLLLKLSGKSPAREELSLNAADGSLVPVLMSANTMLVGKKLVFNLILTDLSAQKKYELELKLKTKQLQQKNAELKIANKNLAHQSREKGKRAAELGIANVELAFQNKEKGDRATELSLANQELAFQNVEKEKRATELSAANKDLTAFTYVSSHDLQEPLRKIQTLTGMILKEERNNLSETGKSYFHRLEKTASRMRLLIQDLLKYSQAKDSDTHFEITDLNLILNEVIEDFEVLIEEKKAKINISHLGNALVIPFQFRQLFHNLISNALKFTRPGIAPRLAIKSRTVNYGEPGFPPALIAGVKYLNISVEDNGIGFDVQYRERIFEVFQRLHSFEEFAGSGIGLALCKRIVQNHNGFIAASSVLNKGARIDIWLPAIE